eukprot:CAMPEP_0184716956 /NCGR_PEP_ID=MMETSP0314-20130426/6534_1 /TAXON_ID=38298 /ORGANISM="Rhodella maculata, Strain CCMP 736" /LENGTH=592 /DNA_ID=CAMNT_0027180449 /DNA_START=56 /DNA_END=1834 /DNA_ORIENTATION=+
MPKHALSDELPASRKIKISNVVDFTPSKWTIGTYLAARMYEVGMRDYFVVPGDYNLTLLDEILKNDKMRMVSCCNELNAGYAADGYSRAKGASCVIVTYTVGGLSLVNAVAGAYSDNLPMLVVSGGINSNDVGSNRVLHHTTGLAKKSQQFEIFEKITSHAAVISNVTGAKHMIDRAFAHMLSDKRPVYLEISCNIANAPVHEPCPFNYIGNTVSSPQALDLAVKAAVKCWDAAVKPVIVGGVGLRASGAIEAIEKLADAAECAVAVMPNAKGMFPEDHKNFIGTYWGSVSSPGCCNIVESSDLYIFTGPIFNDYTTVGYSTLIKKDKMMVVRSDRVTFPDGSQYGYVKMADFLRAFAKVVKANSFSIDAYRRFQEDVPEPKATEETGVLLVKQVQHHVQSILSPTTCLLCETGDAWFQGQRMKLPRGCGYEFQMQYGSIGWSVGALLGYSMALKDEKRVIALIGDGSFQMTAQEVSTMIRYDCNPILILLNNRGYTIEVEIHDGPYNITKNWDYVKLVETFSAGEGHAKAVRVDTEHELSTALKEAVQHTDGLYFIECTLDKDDCTAELLEWGARVASANGRPHKEYEEVL